MRVELEMGNMDSTTCYEEIGGWKRVRRFREKGKKRKGVMAREESIVTWIKCSHIAFHFLPAGCPLKSDMPIIFISF
ncbi:hypothetical protein TSUD_109070 [Trifolium subterraneum]|nr:hypothetical protein TSUD_109070 [Trifolium subterraneum]